MIRFRQALSRLNGSMLSIESGRGTLLQSIVADLARGAEVSDDRIKAAMLCGGKMEFGDYHGPRFAPLGGSGKAIAFVSFKGLVFYDLEAQPYAASSVRFAQNINALAADPSVARIVIDCNSPGGYVTGTSEAANALFAARRRILRTAQSAREDIHHCAVQPPSIERLAPVIGAATSEVR